MLPTAAFAAEVTEQNPVLPDGVEFKEENTVYYDGEYYDKLTDALKAAAGKEGAILYCKPGADVGKMTHGHVCASLTVYGNGAFVSGGENDFEVDTYKGTSCAAHNNCPGLQGDLNITINDLNCSGVWGQRTSEHQYRDEQLQKCRPRLFVRRNRRQQHHDHWQHLHWK